MNHTVRPPLGVRLLHAPSAAADDGWDVLEHVVERAPDWGVDATRAAVFGESTGAAITALAAIRAREAGLPLRAQVLANPCVDLTPAMYDHDSITRYADSPTPTMAQMQLFARLAVPPGLSMPGAVPQAKPARDEIVESLRGLLSA